MAYTTWWRSLSSAAGQYLRLWWIIRWTVWVGAVYMYCCNGAIRWCMAAVSLFLFCPANVHIVESCPSYHWVGHHVYSIRCILQVLYHSSVMVTQDAAASAACCLMSVLATVGQSRLDVSVLVPNSRSVGGTSVYRLSKRLFLLYKLLLYTEQG